MVDGFIKEIKNFIEKNDTWNNDFKKALRNYYDRRDGRIYSFEEHLKSIIFSLLSNHRGWNHIQVREKSIDKIFFNYDSKKIQNTDPEYLVDGIKKIKCGNVNIKNQMKDLADMINVLETISNEYGTIDNYYNNHQLLKKGNPYYLAKELADKNSKYKLKNMGVALICEYLKNVGIDVAKPDTHIRRMLGKNILGFSNKEEADIEESIKYIKEIAEKNNISQTEVDALMWRYCADDYCEICTKDNPKCAKCVIKKYCKKA
jgi:hypothetical protein